MAVATRTMSYDYFDVAVNGATCLDRDTAASTAGGADAEVKAHQRAGSTILIMCGLNDLFQGTSEATTLARILTYVTNRKAAGWANVIVSTLTDASTVSEGSRAALNADILSNAVANSYTTMDPGADANVGCNGCDTNATYFQSDHVHPTATGHGVIAGYLETALTALGLN